MIKVNDLIINYINEKIGRRYKEIKGWGEMKGILNIWSKEMCRKRIIEEKINTIISNFCAHKSYGSFKLRPL